MDVGVAKIVSIPETLLERGTSPLEIPRLEPNVAKWCHDQLKEGFALRYSAIQTRTNVGMPFEITFAADHDAVMFKLFWL